MIVRLKLKDRFHRMNPHTEEGKESMHRENLEATQEELLQVNLTF
jgi:hypothetical protein